MNENVEIIAMSVDTKRLTLWMPDGSTMHIPQGDIRVSRIVDEAKSKGLTTGNPVTVDISVPVHRKTEYESVEKDTGGIIKFFKIAKQKLKEFLIEDSEPVPAPLVPSIKLGDPNYSVKQLTDTAIQTFTNIREASPGYEQPEPTVKEESFGNFSLIIRGFNKEHDHVGMCSVISSVQGCTQQEAFDFANGDLPLHVSVYLTENAAKELATQLNNLKGVFAIASDSPKEVSAYVEPVQSNSDKLKEASAKLETLGAVATGKDEFHKELKEDETIVAVVDNKVIPDVQNLQRQIRQSAKLNDYKGCTKFLQRLASVIDSRLHSVEDLMKFMEKGDLPIADDGSIVIYKRLNSVGDGKYVDCHSGNIKQWVGCKVSVKEELVDQDRRQDCSNGLHVASLSYLRSFYGGVTIIGKVAPEDVFAVPQYNTNKMRVSAYHIIAELPKEMAEVVNNGGSITSVPGGTELLNDVLTGKHEPASTLVMVGGHRGSNLTYSNLSGYKTEDSTKSNVVKTKTTIDLNEDLSTNVNNAEPVRAQDVKPVETKPAKAPTVKEQIQELVKEFQNAKTTEDKKAAADLLVELRGKARKPWGAFGVEGELIAAIAAVRASASKPQPVKAEPVKKDKPGKTAPAKGSKIGDTIRGYLSDSGMGDYYKAHAIHDLKRAAKKSYTALGLTEDECKAIDKLKHHLK